MEQAIQAHTEPEHRRAGQRPSPRQATTTGLPARRFRTFIHADPLPDVCSSPDEA